MKKLKKLQFWILVLSLVFLTYLTSYLVISRHAYAQAEQSGIKGFYYFTPENADSWRWKNYGFIVFYYPINVVDQWLGTGRAPAKEPLWQLSK
jgi:hypothetical protein